jgi:hypothetical protein
MGTRGLTKVIDRNGEIKVAQYGQWDHYPSGQGTKILDILTSRYNSVKHLELALGKCYFINDRDREVIYNDYAEEYANKEEPQDNFTAILPSFSRDTGGDILNVVMWSAGAVPLVDEREFENDDLFCEGVYEINYQTNKFISKYGSQVVEYALDELPEMSDYLDAFAKQEVNA